MTDHRCDIEIVTTDRPSDGIIVGSYKVLINGQAVYTASRMESLPIYFGKVDPLAVTLTLFATSLVIRGSGDD